METMSGFDGEDQQTSWESRFPDFTFGGLVSLPNEETADLLGQFEDLWDKIEPQLQDPILNTGDQFSGFTGHRIVTFKGSIGRCALGFRLFKNGAVGYSTIIADRRKIYASPKRRILNVSDTTELRASEIADAQDNSRLLQRLGTFATWVDKFNASEPYS